MSDSNINIETEPLLDQDQEEPTEQQPPTKIAWVRQVVENNPRKTITLLVAIFLTAMYFVVYFAIIPVKVQAAFQGQGSNITAFNVRELDPIMLDVSLTVPISPQSISVEVDLGEFTAFTESHFKLTPKLPLGNFELPHISVSPGQTIVDIIDAPITVSNPNLAYISWLATNIIKHGFTTEKFSLECFPSVYLPFFRGSWSVSMKNYYEFQAGNGTLDLDQFNFHTSDVSLSTVETDKGLTQYLVSLTASFYNPYRFSISELDTTLEATVYYKDVPVFHINTAGDYPFQLKVKDNDYSIEIQSIPEYTAELMELVGLISEGEDAQIAIADIELTGYSDTWIQDMLDGWMANIVVPGMSEGFLPGIKDLLDQLQK
ncbi:hypothetical protein HK103_004320 [Boothiomyces macroporosus]|uniref:Uncharacterized protein n=1 Tax=Boothiomyces macroporosus TaxID=261099 RepID=A0AAD5Y5W3_9FUNG|nr:hypothetical protein HK103_004320 [Boothiomyces macroporosus]